MFGMNSGHATSHLSLVKGSRKIAMDLPGDQATDPPGFGLRASWSRELDKAINRAEGLLWR